MENFDDSAFDQEEMFIDLEEMNNLYEESKFMDDLIARGENKHISRLKQWSKYVDPEIGRAYRKYDAADKKYFDHTKNGFRLDYGRHQRASDTYNRNKIMSDNDIQNKRRAVEDAFRSRMRQATTKEERLEAKKARDNMMAQIERDRSNYDRELGRVKSHVKRFGKNNWKKTQENEYNTKATTLKNKREEYGNDFKKQADDFALRKSVDLKDKYSKVDPRTGLSKYDRKMIKRGYKEMDAERDVAKFKQIQQNAPTNGYFGDVVGNKKNELRGRYAAQGKLPDHLKDFSL